MNFPRETIINACAWINHRETFINLKENRKIPKEKKKNGKIYTEQNKPQKRKELPLAEAETESCLW